MYHMMFYTFQLKDIDELSRKYNFEQDLHQRMHEFFHHKYGGSICDDDQLINELPLALKIVSSTSTLGDQSPNFVSVKSIA